MPGISIVKATVFTKIKGFCSQYKAVYDKLVELDDVPDSLIAKEQNKMVRQNVAYVGWADVFDVFYLFAQYSNNGGGALINWINPGTFLATEQPNGGVLTWTSLEGYKSDGANSYLDTDYNPTDDAINYALNNASIGIYSRTNRDANEIDIGVCDGTQCSYIISRYLDDYITRGPNDATNSNTSNNDSRGLFTVVRDGANSKRLFKNSGQLSTDNIASMALLNKTFYICAMQGGGGSQSHSERQISIAFIGSALDITKIGILFNAIETYMDYNGKGVA